MVLSSEFFPSPRAGASGMMEMTPARARIRASDRYLVIDCPPPCWKITPGYGGLALPGLTRMKLTRPPRGPVNSHPWIQASVGDAIGSQVVSNGCWASYWNCGKRAVLQNSPRPLIPKSLSRILESVVWGCFGEPPSSRNSPKQPQTTDSKILIKNWLCCAPG